MTDKECISGLEVLKQIPHAKNFVEYIDFAIKAVEQNRPKGTWKEHDTTFGRNIYYCTACGRSIEILYEYDFCPLCGADMRKVEE